MTLGSGFDSGPIGPGGMIGESHSVSGSGVNEGDGKPDDSLHFVIAYPCL